MTPALLIADPQQRRRALIEEDANTPIDGCAECGQLERHHRDAGHGFDPPTEQLREVRRGARRLVAA